MADYRDQPGLDEIGSLELFVLNLKLPGLFGDLFFNIALPDLEPAGPPPDDPHDHPAKKTDPQHPEPGLLIPVWLNIKAADGQAIFRMVGISGLPHQQTIFA